MQHSVCTLHSLKLLAVDLLVVVAFFEPQILVTLTRVKLLVE